MGEGRQRVKGKDVVSFKFENLRGEEQWQRRGEEVSGEERRGMKWRGGKKERRRGEERRVEEKRGEEGRGEVRRGEVTAGKRRIRSRKKIIKNTKYGRKRGDLLNGGRSHVPLGKRGRNREGKRKKSQVSAGVGGVEVLGVLVAGRGAGIQGNGLFLIIQTPPFTYTHRQKRPPHGPMTTLS